MAKEYHRKCENFLRLLVLTLLLFCSLQAFLGLLPESGYGDSNHVNHQSRKICVAISFSGK